MIALSEMLWYNHLKYDGRRGGGSWSRLREVFYGGTGGSFFAPHMRMEVILMNNGQLQAFLQGMENHAYWFMGCHPCVRDGKSGYVFRVWAPHAKRVHVVGSFNGWNPEALPMQPLEGGIFEAFSEDAAEYDLYKYYIEKPNGGCLWKSDPYGFFMQAGPEYASRIYDLSGYAWKDGAYRRAAARKKLMQNPIHIYEVHPGSWKHKEDGSWYSYRELIRVLLPYVLDMGYTHIELLPLAEYSDEDSLGYQTTGFYAPTARYGEPKELMAFIDACHEAGIGVILDWSVAGFPKNEHGLRDFDGTSCYEPDDPVMRETPRRDLRLFDFGRKEVCSFLLSNAVYWLEEYHLDGLRIGGAASILRLDYGRTLCKPNADVSFKNQDGAEFLRLLTQMVSELRGNLILAVDDDSAQQGITKPVGTDGFGFTLKWASDWTRDLLKYLMLDPVYRKYHHENLTFAMNYFYQEQMLLPVSRDTLTGANGSLMEQIPGYYDDKFANFRTLLGYQMAHPGKKLTFMGTEIAQFARWDGRRSLDWFLLAYDRHSQMQTWVRDLNHFYLDQRPLWHNDSDPDGFRWIRMDDCDHSLLAFTRIDRKGAEVLVICNFCPVVWDHCRIGLPKKGCWIPALSSDSQKYGGTGVPVGAVRTEPVSCDGLDFSAEFTIPPLSVNFYVQEK